MKIALMLLCCTLLALAITALPPRQAQAAASPYTTSEELADAMSSHGIETADSSSDDAALRQVAYKPEAGPQ